MCWFFCGTCCVVTQKYYSLLLSCYGTHHEPQVMFTLRGQVLLRTLSAWRGSSLADHFVGYLFFSGLPFDFSTISHFLNLRIPAWGFRHKSTEISHRIQMKWRLQDAYFSHAHALLEVSSQRTKPHLTFTSDDILKSASSSHHHTYPPSLVLLSWFHLYISPFDHPIPVQSPSIHLAT